MLFELLFAKIYISSSLWDHFSDFDLKLRQDKINILKQSDWDFLQDPSLVKAHVIDNQLLSKQKLVVNIWDCNIWRTLLLVLLWKKL